MAGALVVLVLLIAIIAPLVLYYFVRKEHDRRQTMDRHTAEQTARRDTRDRD